MTAEQSQSADLTFERVFASPGLDGASPRAPKLSPNGRYLTLLRNRAEERERYDLWGYDRETGEWTMLVDSEKLGSGRELSEDEKMQRERARVGNLKGIISYQWNSDGSGVLVPLDGDLYLAKLDGTVTRLTDTEESELNPKLSEEGEYVSFVRDRQLWVGPVGGDARPITPKEGELIRWGEAEFVAQEEMGASPDTGGALTTRGWRCSGPTRARWVWSPARPSAQRAPRCSTSAIRSRAATTRSSSCS